MKLEEHIANGAPQAQPSGRRHWLQSDRIVGLLLFVGCGIFFRETFYLPPPVWDPLGMAFWPRILIGALALVALILILRGHLGSTPPETIKPAAFVVVAIGGAYVLVMENIGFALATPIFMFVALLLLGLPVTKRRIIDAIVLAGAGTLLVQFLFHNLLRVSLPEGEWLIGVLQ